MVFLFRFVCKQSRMDAIPIGAGSTPGHRRFSIIWKVSASTQILNGFIHAGRKSGRRPFQKRDICGWSQSPFIDQRRRWFTGATGKLLDKKFIIV